MSDFTIIACRPVELDPNDPFEAQILDMTFVYDGSVKARCRRCNREVWVGPRQQEALASDPSIPIGCFLCAATPEGNLAARLGLLDVHDLGNPQERPK